MSYLFPVFLTQVLPLIMEPESCLCPGNKDTCELQGTERQGRIDSGNCQCGEVQPPLPWFHRCEIRTSFEGEKGSGR